MVVGTALAIEGNEIGVCEEHVGGRDVGWSFSPVCDATATASAVVDDSAAAAASVVAADDCPPLWQRLNCLIIVAANGHWFCKIFGFPANFCGQYASQ